MPVAPLLKVKEFVSMVEASISSEKVTEIVTSTGTFVVPLRGVFELTTGGVVSGAEPVVNDQV